MLLSETFSFLASQWRWCGGDCCCLNPSRIERANEDCTVILWLWRNKASRFRKSSVRHRKFWQSATIGVGGSFPGVDAGVGLSAHFTFHWWSTQHAARMMLLSDKLMSCCAAGTNGCLDLRRCAFALDGRVSTVWSRCPGSMARRSRYSVASLRRSSAGWMPARIGRLSPGVRRRHSHDSQATISTDCWLLQSCWQPNFIHVMSRSRSWKFSKVGVLVGHFISDSATLGWECRNHWQLFSNAP